VVETTAVAAATIRTVDGAAVMAAIVDVVEMAEVVAEMAVAVAPTEEVVAEMAVGAVVPRVAGAALVAADPAEARVKVRARGILAEVRNLVAAAVVLQVRHPEVVAAGRHSFTWVCG
jgi:hypothetical protein